MERNGWDRCVVVADEFGVAAATYLAGSAPHAVQALAAGHARLSNSLDGERAPLNREVYAGIVTMMRADPRMFVRQFFMLTGGETREGGYSEKMVDAYLERVPVSRMAAFWESRLEEGAHIGDLLRALDAPILLARHKGCLLYTDEGFEDAVSAMPRAHSVTVDEKPSTSVEFAQLLEAFCREHVPVSA
jgi:hypothetical protein